MEATIQKWGNSLGVRLPKPVAHDLGLSEHSRVRLTLQDGGLLIEPIERSSRRSRSERISLEFYASQITPENRHGETDFGAPQGRELI